VPADCLNCGAGLLGPYCSLCGQKHDPHPPTAGHLFAETVETVTHADSRLWRTFATLLSRPGKLTREWLEGRRARYLPPFRLYLIASVVCFLLLAALPSHDTQAVAPQADGKTVVGGPQSGAALAFEGGEADCARLAVTGVSGSVEAALEQRLRDACVRVVRDGGKGLGEAFLRGLPKAMFVLLPLFALLPLAFYWRPRRLYAEHLLLLVHNHSALFIALSAEQLVGAALPAGIASLTTPVLGVWAVWYVYRSMRTCYGEPRGRTLAKAAALGLLYVFMASMALAFTGLAALLTF
jgi:hypothetical protein